MHGCGDALFLKYKFKISQKMNIVRIMKRNRKTLSDFNNLYTQQANKYIVIFSRNFNKY